MSSSYRDNGTTQESIDVPNYQSLPKHVNSTFPCEQIQDVPLDLSLPFKRDASNGERSGYNVVNSCGISSNKPGPLSCDMQNGCGDLGSHIPHTRTITTPFSWRTDITNLYPPSGLSHSAIHAPCNQYESWLQLRQKSALYTMPLSTFGQTPGYQETPVQGHEKGTAAVTTGNHPLVHRPVSEYPHGSFIPFSSNSRILPGIATGFAQGGSGLMFDENRMAMASTKYNILPSIHGLSHHLSASTPITPSNQSNTMDNFGARPSEFPFYYDMIAQSGIQVPYRNLPASEAHAFAPTPMNFVPRAAPSSQHGQHPIYPIQFGVGSLHNPTVWGSNWSSMGSRDCLFPSSSTEELTGSLPKTYSMSDNLMLEKRMADSNQVNEHASHPPVNSLARSFTNFVDINCHNHNNVSAQDKGMLSATGLNFEQSLRQDFSHKFKCMLSHQEGQNTVSHCVTTANDLPREPDTSASLITVTDSQKCVPSTSRNLSDGHQRQRLSPLFAGESGVFSSSMCGLHKSQPNKEKNYIDTMRWNCSDQYENTNTAPVVTSEDAMKIRTISVDTFFTMNKTSDSMAFAVDSKDEYRPGSKDLARSGTVKSNCNAGSLSKQPATVLILKDRNNNNGPFTTVEPDGHHHTMTNSSLKFGEKNASNSQSKLTSSTVRNSDGTEFAETKNANEHRKDRTPFTCKRCKSICRSFSDLLQHQSIGCSSPPLCEPVHSTDCLGKRGLYDRGPAGTDCQCTQCPMCKGIFGSMFRVFSHVQRGCYRKTGARIFQIGASESERYQTPVSFEMLKAPFNSTSRNLTSNETPCKNDHDSNKPANITTLIVTKELANQQTDRISQQSHMLRPKHKLDGHLENSSSNTQSKTGNCLTRKRRCPGQKRIVPGNLIHQAINEEKEHFSPKLIETKKKDEATDRENIHTEDNHSTAKRRRHEDYSSHENIDRVSETIHRKGCVGKVNLPSITSFKTAKSPVFDKSHGYLQGSLVNIQARDESEYIESTTDDKLKVEQCNLAGYIETDPAEIHENQAAYSEVPMMEELKNLVKQEIQDDEDVGEKNSNEVESSVPEMIVKIERDCDSPPVPCAEYRETTMAVRDLADRHCEDKKWNLRFRNKDTTDQGAMMQADVASRDFVNDIKINRVKSETTKENDRVHPCRVGLFSGEIFPSDFQSMDLRGPFSSTKSGPDKNEQSLVASQAACSIRNSLKYPKTEEYKPRFTLDHNKMRASLRRCGHLKTKTSEPKQNPQESQRHDSLGATDHPSEDITKDHVLTNKEFESHLTRKTKFGKIIECYDENVQNSERHNHSVSRSKPRMACNQMWDSPNSTTPREKTTTISVHLDDTNETHADPIVTPGTKSIFKKLTQPNIQERQERQAGAHRKDERLTGDSGKISLQQRSEAEPKVKEPTITAEGFPVKMAIAFGESRRTCVSGVRERIVYALDADKKPVMLVEREGQETTPGSVKSMLTCSDCGQTFPTLFLFLWHQQNTCKQSNSQTCH